MRRSRPKKKAAVKVRKRSASVRSARKVTRGDGEREDRLLAAGARKALADPERTPYEQVRRDLGLD